ncbi:MAG: DUF6496 domain-containing protein [Bdellovibrio sp.]
MPEKRTIERAKKDARQGKAPSTQAGEFVKEEIDKIRKGVHGARSPQQAIAIGLSEARKAGVKLPPPPGKQQKKTKKKTNRGAKNPAVRAKATLKALKKEPRSSVSPQKLAEHTKEVAKRRGPAKRSEAAQKAVQTKGKAGLHRAAKKAAETRREHAH